MKILNRIKIIPNAMDQFLATFFSFGVSINPEYNCWHPSTMNIIGNATLALMIFNKNPIGNINAITDMDKNITFLLSFK